MAEITIEHACHIQIAQWKTNSEKELLDMARKTHGGTYICEGEGTWVELDAPQKMIRVESPWILTRAGTSTATVLFAWTALRVRRGAIVRGSVVGGSKKRGSDFVELQLQLCGKTVFSTLASNSLYLKEGGDWVVGAVYADSETGLYCRLDPVKVAPRM